VRRVRKVYAARREALVDALERHLTDVLEFELPPGGLALWPRVVDDVDPVAWAARAREKGVVFTPGADLDFRGRPQPYLRLGFAALSEPEIEQAVKRMKVSLQ